MIDPWHLRGRAGALALAAALAAAPPASAEPARAAPAEPARAAPAEPARAASPALSMRPARPAVVLPTAVAPEAVERVAQLASALDALLSDTAQDLGLALDLPGRVASRAPLDEAELVAQARAGTQLVIAPSLALRGELVELRMALAPPGARSLRVRVERVARDDLAVRAAVMLRDLLAELDGGAAAAPRPREEAPCSERCRGSLATPARSAGKATLAANATLYGGLVGFSIQRSSGSDDPRLLYPLLAVGAGIGLGGAMIIAEEWDIGVADAWFLGSAAWWPTIAGHLVYQGRFAEHAGDPGQERWASGLIGGTAGISLAALGLSLGPMSEGGALLAQSGGGLGLLLGGLVEWAARADVYETPIAGMGYGAALGWLAAAAAATQVDVTASQVLSIDVGALLGGLGAAALASPLVFESPTPAQQRAWVGASAGGFLLGAGVAWFMTRPAPAGGRAASASWNRVGLPMIGVIGESVVGGLRAPALGLGWQGTLP
ncbi:hypothetical protein SOCEGT47_058430 [Sorangium cellulosum]|uniref:Secreted protein n=1 Tax=Sorangium cellulosum TaxID=56 RepID=A0A4P2Q782_SORCE|nr:hypothetical protein [Sorangium cellulosum]AUX25299.1 hypothetical protein SOCEGT47_058430 [Sorangium cellulosum]